HHQRRCGGQRNHARRPYPDSDRRQIRQRPQRGTCILRSGGTLEVPLGTGLPRSLGKRVGDERIPYPPPPPLRKESESSWNGRSLDSAESNTSRCAVRT